MPLKGIEVVKNCLLIFPNKPIDLYSHEIVLNLVILCAKIRLGA